MSYLADYGYGDFDDVDYFGEDGILAQMIEQLKSVKSNVLSAEERRQKVAARHAQAIAAYGDKGDVYVDSCPPGYLACGVEEDCPDEIYGSVPPMYNADGSKCYLSEGMMLKRREKVMELSKKVKAERSSLAMRDTREVALSVQSLREFTRLAATLVRELNSIGKVAGANQSCADVNQLYPGSDDSSKTHRAAYCENMVGANDERSCKVSSAGMCESV